MGSDAQRVVVTGAAGFVGLNVVEWLLAAGHFVVAVDSAAIPTAARSELDGLAGSLHEVMADITDPSAITPAIAEADVVIHGAAITAGADRERTHARRVIEVNVTGTQTVLDAVAATGTVRRVVYVSSGAVYGEKSFGAELMDETTTPEPVSLYAITKLTGEQLVRRHGALHETDVAIARLSAVFGPWERHTGVRDSISPMYAMAGARRRGAVVAASAYAPRNWLYSRDAAAALSGLALAPSLAHDLYNVSPTERSEPMQWARHVGLDTADASSPENADVVELPAEDRQADPRAPVANDRIRAELPGWPSYGPEEAFADYAGWLEAHDALG